MFVTCPEFEEVLTGSTKRSTYLTKFSFLTGVRRVRI